MTAQAPPAKKRRGRESAGDMVRSLGLVLAGVVVVWYFAQPPDSDEQRVRVVDPVGDVRAFSADVPAAPVPTRVPADWRPTSTTRTGSSLLRIGYVLPGERFAEYAASTGPVQELVPDLTGSKATSALRPVDVDGVTWQQYADDDGSLSLVRTFGPVTVVAGTKRGTATLDDLLVLVRSLSTG